MSQTTIDGGGPGGSFVDGVSIVDATVMEALRGNIPDAETRLAALETVNPSGTGTIRRLLKSFNSTEIKAFPSAESIIIPAPGAGFWLWVHSVVAEIECLGPSSYTNINADAYCHFHTADWTVDKWDYLVSGDGGEATATGRTEVTDFFQSVGKQRWNVKPWISPGTEDKFSTGWGGNTPMDDPDAVENQAFVFLFENQGDGPLTGGNAGDQMKVLVYYTIEPMLT